MLGAPGALVVLFTPIWRRIGANAQVYEALTGPTLNRSSTKVKRGRGIVEMMRLQSLLGAFLDRSDALYRDLGLAFDVL